MNCTYRLLTVAGLLFCTASRVPAQEPGIFVDGGWVGGPIVWGDAPLAGDPGQFPPLPGGRGGGPGGPARDGAQAPQGTGKIAGRIIATDSGSPVRRAQVRVTAAEARTNRVATTDNQGRYEITGLPAGRYRLYVSKTGYVTLEYGQARPFEAGKLLDIADAQTLDKIDFSLPRGSVITGRITDEFGEPLADASVQALRYQFTNGQRQLVNAGRPGMSDDIGQFRIFGLMPGDYIIRATVRANATAVRAAAVIAMEEPSGYPPTYYPGTTDIAQAQPVTVSLGQELSAVTLSLLPARLARVSGTVSGSDGKPLGGAIVVVRPARGGAVGPLNIGGANQVRADGSFALSNVPPGDYTLDVQQRPQGMSSGGLGGLEFASIPLSVSGEDISGLTILTTAGVTVSGRIAFQGQKSPASAAGMQVTVSPPGGAQSIIGLAGRVLGGGRVDDSGVFTLRGLFGRQVIRVANIPAGWALQSILVDNEDITDTGFEFKPGANVTNVVIALTDRLTEISGTVRDSRDAVSKDYVLVIFPEDRALWEGQSRFVRAARPNQDGNFNVKGLPPARYLAAAVESLEIGAQNDPALLEQLRPAAKSFALTEGQSLSLTLGISAIR